MANNVLQHIDLSLERSPVCKRARFDVEPSDLARWTLTKNELVLHSVYDSGIGCLGSEGSELELKIDPTTRKKRKCSEMESPYSPTELDREREEIALLEATLPENTLQKLSLGELEKLQILQQDLPNSSHNINYFNYLSDEVILQIFQKLTKGQLSNAALVCKRFRQLTADESLWTRMDLSNRSLSLEAGSIGTILSRQVIILRLSGTEIAHPPILPNVKAASPEFRCRLMYLDLSMATVATTSLSMIFGITKRLKKVSLESVPVDDKVLMELAKSKDLEVVNLAMCEGIELDGLQYFLTSCRNIREINLSWTYLNADCIRYICENLPSTVSRLNLSGCRKLLRDEDVAKLVKCCRNLRELDLSDCTEITGKAVQMITTLQELNFLAMSRCYRVPYGSFLDLKKIKNLSYLDIHGNVYIEEELRLIKEGLGPSLNINKFKFSSVARPSVGNKAHSIWNMRIKD